MNRHEKKRFYENKIQQTQSDIHHYDQMMWITEDKNSSIYKEWMRTIALKERVLEEVKKEYQEFLDTTGGFMMTAEQEKAYKEHYSLSKEELIAGCEKRIKGILEASVQIDELARKNGFCGKWQYDLTEIQTKKRHYYQEAIRRLKGRK